MRPGLSIGAVLALAATAWSTTLEQLSMTSMVQQSTAVVRARVLGSAAALHGANIYTHYQLEILETLKAGPAAPSSVAVPGGAAGGVRQVVAGSPKLAEGAEYVLFLWTSPSGLTQVIGLTQGVFRIENNTAFRAASTEPMVDPHGKPVNDQAVSMTLEALRRAVRGKK